MNKRNSSTRTNLMCVHSRAFVASSCVSNCTNAKLRLIRTWRTFPYGSKCFSISRTLVRMGSKLIINSVLVGLWFATDLDPSRCRPRSPCHNIQVKFSTKFHRLMYNYYNQTCTRQHTLAHSTVSLRLSYPNGVLSRA